MEEERVPGATKAMRDGRRCEMERGLQPRAHACHRGMIVEHVVCYFASLTILVSWRFTRGEQPLTNDAPLCAILTMLTHVGAEESSKSAMYVLAPLFKPLITCREEQAWDATMNLCHLSVHYMLELEH